MLEELAELERKEAEERKLVEERQRRRQEELRKENVRRAEEARKKVEQARLAAEAAKKKQPKAGSSKGKERAVSEESDESGNDSPACWNCRSRGQECVWLK